MSNLFPTALLFVSPPLRQSVDLLRRRVRNASIWYLGHRRIRGSRLPDQDAGHAQTDRKARDGRRMVSLASRVRVLVE